MRSLPPSPDEWDGGAGGQGTGGQGAGFARAIRRFFLALRSKFLWPVLTDPVSGSFFLFFVFLACAIALSLQHANDAASDSSFLPLTPTSQRRRWAGLASCSDSQIPDTPAVATVQLIFIGLSIGSLLQYGSSALIKMVRVRRSAVVVAFVIFTETVVTHSLIASRSTVALCTDAEGYGGVRVIHPLRYLYWLCSTPPIVVMVGRLAALPTRTLCWGWVGEALVILFGMGSAVCAGSPRAFWVLFALSLLAFFWVYRVLHTALGRVVAVGRGKRTGQKDPVLLVEWVAIFAMRWLRSWRRNEGDAGAANPGHRLREDQQQPQHQHGLAKLQAASRQGSSLSTVKPLIVASEFPLLAILGPMALTLWVSFPVVWLCGFLDAISPSTEAILWPILDVAAKIVFSQLWMTGDFASLDKAIEDQLVAIERQRDFADTSNAAKRKLMRYVFHELRVPLNSIVLGVEDICATAVEVKGENGRGEEEDGGVGGSPPAPLANLPEGSSYARRVESCVTSVLRTAEVVRDNTTAMQKLLNDFLSLEKIEEGKFELEVGDFSPAQLVEDVVRMFAAPLAAKHLRLRKELRPSVPARMRGDMHKLRQVLSNYLSNAIKFSPAGGDISVRVELVSSSWVRGGGGGGGVVKTPGTGDTGAGGGAAAAGGSPTLAKVIVEGDNPSTHVASGASSRGSDGRTGRKGRNESDAGSYDFESAGDDRKEKGKGSDEEEEGEGDGPLFPICLPPLRLMLGGKAEGASSGNRVAPSNGDTPSVFNAAQGGSRARVELLSSSSSSGGSSAAAPLAISAPHSSSSASTEGGERRSFVGQVAPHAASPAGPSTEASSPAAAQPEPVPPTFFVRFSVADDGPGVSDEDKKKLFLPFTQIQAGALQQGNGCGLGLSICKRIVELSGGKVGVVSSRDGKGANFFFQVPHVPPCDADADGAQGGSVGPANAAVVEAAARSAAQPAASGTAGASSSPLSSSSSPSPPLVPLRSALVVDDVTSNRVLFGRIIQRRGVRCVTYAEDGLEALEVVKKVGTVGVGEVVEQGGAGAGDQPPFQAIFLDSKMPRCDGYTCASRLRALSVRCPIIGVTGDALAEDQAAFLAAGATRVVTKPVSLDDVEAALAQAGLCLRLSSSPFPSFSSAAPLK